MTDSAVLTFRPMARWWLFHGLVQAALTLMIVGIATNVVNGPFRAYSVEFPDWVAGLVFALLWLLSGFWLVMKPVRVVITDREVQVFRWTRHSDFHVERSAVEIVEHEFLGRVSTMIGLRSPDSRWRAVIRINAFADKDRDALRQALLAFQRRAGHMSRQEHEGMA